MVRRYNRVLDRFTISFKCSNQPVEGTGLKGFKPECLYKGRTYNGLYEVSTEWGSGKPTVLLDRKVFEKYFKLAEQEVVE